MVVKPKDVFKCISDFVTEKSGTVGQNDKVDVTSEKTTDRKETNPWTMIIAGRMPFD